MSLSKFDHDRGLKRITYGFYFMLRKQNLEELTGDSLLTTRLSRIKREEGGQIKK